MALPGQPPTVARHEYGLTENVAAFVEQLFRAFTLPAESIFHTTFGERYFTPAAAAGALAIIISAAYVAAQPADLPADVAARLPARIQQPGLSGANPNPLEKQQVLKPDLPLLLFAFVFLVLAAVHYGCIVRRRLNRRPYVHSRYTGQPYAILLVVTRPLAPWFTLDEREFCFKMFVEPGFVLGLALILVRLQAFIFGYYLMLVAAALYFRAYLEYCRLRNQFLDMLDDMVENDFMSAAIDRQEAAEETIGFAIPGVSTVSPGDCERLAAYRWPPSNVEQAIQGLDQTLRNLITGKEADGGEDVEKVDAHENPLSSGNGAPQPAESKQGPAGASTIPPGAEELDPELRKLLCPEVPSASSTTAVGQAAPDPKDPLPHGEAENNGSTENAAHPAVPKDQSTDDMARWLEHALADARRSATPNRKKSSQKEIACPNCDKKYRVPIGRSGKITCKQCKELFHFDP